MLHAVLVFVSLAFSTRVDVTGDYTSNWDEVHLVQEGDKIHGTYVCCGGGTIEGRIIEGRIIKYEWDEPRGAMASAARLVPFVLDDTALDDAAFDRATAATHVRAVDLVAFLDEVDFVPVTRVVARHIDASGKRERYKDEHGVEHARSNARNTSSIYG